MKFHPTIVKARWQSPLGPMIVAATARGIAGIWFEGQRHMPDHSKWPVQTGNPFLEEAKRVFPGLRPTDRVKVTGLETDLTLADAATGIQRIYQQMLDRAWADAKARGEKLPPLDQKNAPPSVPEGQQ